jgi:hypothetical protein
MNSILSAPVIATAFVAMPLSGAFLAWGLNSRRFWLAKFATIVGLSGALICVTAGLFMLPAWADPLAGQDVSARAAVSGRGGGGVVIMAIKFWPYVLVGLGGYVAYHSYQNLKCLREIFESGIKV